MPKARKSSSTRRPPEAAGSHAVIEQWMETQMPRVQPLLKHMDATIRKAIPDLDFAVKWSKAYYGTQKLGWIIELAAYHVSANVVFLGGPKMDPAPPEGEGPSRYIKIRSLAEADTPEMEGWLKQARSIPGWKA